MRGRIAATLHDATGKDHSFMRLMSVYSLPRNRGYAYDVRTYMQVAGGSARGRPLWPAARGCN